MSAPFDAGPRGFSVHAIVVDEIGGSTCVPVLATPMLRTHAPIDQPRDAFGPSGLWGHG
jgi:hypothetical protein